MTKIHYTVLEHICQSLYNCVYYSAVKTRNSFEEREIHLQGFIQPPSPSLTSLILEVSAEYRGCFSSSFAECLILRYQLQLVTLARHRKFPNNLCENIEVWKRQGWGEITFRMQTLKSKFPDPSCTRRETFLQNYTPKLLKNLVLSNIAYTGAGQKRYFTSIQGQSQKWPATHVPFGGFHV